MKRNFVRCAVLALGAVLLATNVARAQYLYGYYYPSENRFHVANDIGRSRADFIGRPAFMQDRYTTTPVAPAAPVVPVARPGRICLVVPDAGAKVWFEGYGTKSTGTSRVFQTPPITAGATFKYHLKVTWKESGQDVSLERDVAVMSGQTADVDFTEAAAALKMSRRIAAAKR